MKKREDGSTPRVYMNLITENSNAKRNLNLDLSN